MKTKRVEWIDVLKGIGILSVVAGHVFSGITNSILFLFHMPLFFTIAGMLYNPPSSDRAFLRKKAIHLLIPYFVFLILLSSPIIIPNLIFLFRNANISSFFDISKTIGTLLYGGRYLDKWTTVFWFVTCLFFTQQLFNFLYKRCNQSILLVFLAICIAVSYINSSFFPNWYFPWNINVVFAAIPFFAFGYFFNKIQDKSFVYIISVALSTFAIILIKKGYKISYDMKVSYYGFPLLSLILAIATIVSLIYISKLIVHISLFKNILIYFGSASMSIMYLHHPIQRSFRLMGIGDEWIRFTIASLLPLILYYLLEKRALTRAIFLGSYQDFEKLFLSNKT